MKSRQPHHKPYPTLPHLTLPYFIFPSSAFSSQNRSRQHYCSPRSPPLPPPLCPPHHYPSPTPNASRTFPHHRPFPSRSPQTYPQDRSPLAPAIDGHTCRIWPAVPPCYLKPRRTLDLEERHRNGGDGVWYAVSLRRRRFRSHRREQADCRRGRLER